MRVSHALLVSAMVSACLPAQSAPCFESNLGANIGAGDDTLSYGCALGFYFPGPGGNYTTIDICSNGFIWLGTNPLHNSFFGPSDAAFLVDDPRVAAAWMDLYPPGAVGTGGVYFNTIPASGSDPARAVITWYQVPEAYFYPPVTAQVQLIATGEIRIFHDGGNVAPAASFHNELVGVTQGLGATANIVDFGAIPSGGGANTGSNPTAFCTYYGQPDNVAGDVISFIPNGAGGYSILLNSQCAMYMTFGAGCLDRPATFYEVFTGPSHPFDLGHSTISMLNIGTSYFVEWIPGSPAWFTPTSTALSAGPYAFTCLWSWDDAVSQPITLPWTLNYPTGSTNSISVGSNGTVLLGTPTLGDSCFFTGISSWLGTGPTLAVAYGNQDVTSWPTYGIYYDVDPSGNAVYITWITSEHGYGFTQDFQVMIDSTGNIEYRYLSINLAGTPTLVGWCPGGGVEDPGPIDISSVGTFVSGDGSPATTLINTGGALPALGSTFSQDVGSIRPGSAVGFVCYGFGNLLPTGFSLAPFGAPGCTQWINLLVNQLFLVTGSTTAVTLPIPNTPSLAGLVLQSQAAVLSPGINALGAVVSNGAAMTLGF